MGLREQKKQEMRVRLAGTAARMFLERGFDAVRVAEVAEACGVSEKTVFNYFPTKEALLLDQLEQTMTALRSGLIRPGVPVIEAALAILQAELAATTARFSEPGALAVYQRFGDLIRATPSLRAYRSEMMDRFVAVAAEVLGDADDPEVQAVASALLGLWRVQFHSLRRHVADGRTPAEIRALVGGDVRRAATVLENGLGFRVSP